MSNYYDRTESNDSLTALTLGVDPRELEVSIKSIDDFEPIESGIAARDNHRDGSAKNDRASPDVSLNFASLRALRESVNQSQQEELQRQLSCLISDGSLGMGGVEDTAIPSLAFSAARGDEQDDEPLDAAFSSVLRESKPVPPNMELTPEEERDNETWRRRLMSNEKFSPKYEPKEVEVEEMDAIVKFLDLKNPAKDPEFLVSVLFLIQTERTIYRIFHVL